MRWWPLIAALGARALRPNLDLGLTARALAASFRDCRGESCSVDVLDGFAGAAVAAFRNAYSLDVLLMELDLADDERLPREDRARRAEWLRAVRSTLGALDGGPAAALEDVPADALDARVAAVVARATARGLDIERGLAAASCDVDRVVLLAARHNLCAGGEELEPGATG